MLYPYVVLVVHVQTEVAHLLLELLSFNLDTSNTHTHKG